VIIVVFYLFFDYCANNHFILLVLISLGSDDAKGIEVKRTVGLLSGIAFIVGSIIGNIIITPNKAVLFKDFIGYFI